MRDIREIVLKVIPHKKHRYETVGDFFFDKKGTLQIRVSELGDVRMNLLVLIHELAEVVQTEYKGPTEKQIAAFDRDFERLRLPGNVDEPGDSKACAYKKQHCLATGIERIMCAALDVDWQTYTEICNAQSL